MSKNKRLGYSLFGIFTFAYWLTFFLIESSSDRQTVMRYII